MDFAASTIEFQDASRQYGRELEHAVKDGGSITEGLKFTRQELDDRSYCIDFGSGTFWHMVGNDSGVAVSHRALVAHAKDMVSLAARIEETEPLSSDDLAEWQAAARASSTEFRRFAAAIGGLVGFRLPGAMRDR